MIFTQNLKRANYNYFKPHKIKVFAIAVSTFLLVSCGDSNPPGESTKQPVVQSESVNTTATNKQSETLEQLYQQAARTLFSARALSATMFAISVDDVGSYYADQLEDYSPEKEREMRNQLLQLSEKINNYSIDTKNAQAFENQQVMLNLARYFAGNPEFSIGYIDVWMGLSPFIVNQINGPLIDIPRYMQSDQMIKSEKDALDYLKRLEQFDQLVTSLQAKLSADVALGWVAPKVILQGASRYFENFTASTAAQHPLVTEFANKLTKLDNISDQQKQKFLNQAIERVEKIVYPAYQKINLQTQELIKVAPTESGIWAQPNGAAYYQDAIEQLGDSNLTAQQIHEIGLAEVTRITLQMDALLKQQNYTQGSVGERMVALNHEPRFLYENSEQGRQTLLADLNGYISEITKKMAPVFKTKPAYQVEVRAFPVEIQDGAAGGQYTAPAMDGSKPGIYWINLKDIFANPKFSLKTLTYHEANPGHHWQVSLNLEQDQLPLLRRVAPYNAYIEGWALYSEQIAAEIGLYKDDPFGDLGRLQAELFRAVRLVVDTGIHHKRWTREQAIEYMTTTTGSAESDVVSEIERYIAWPGQALGYKLGMLKILELRKKAKMALADDFDLAEFHDVVLLGGAVPMKVLELKINQWISRRKNR